MTGGDPELGSAMARRYFEDIFDRQDLAVCDEILADDYVEHAPAPFGQGEPGAVNGPTATRETARWLLAQFPDLRFVIEAVVAADDIIAVRVFGTGTNLGPIGPIPATGRSFASRSSHWFRVRDGRLAEHWAIRDDLTTMLQLGVVRPPTGAAGEA